MNLEGTIYVNEGHRFIKKGALRLICIDKPSGWRPAVKKLEAANQPTDRYKTNE